MLLCGVVIFVVWFVFRRGWARVFLLCIVCLFGCCMLCRLVLLLGFLLCGVVLFSLGLGRLLLVLWWGLLLRFLR